MLRFEEIDTACRDYGWSSCVALAYLALGMLTSCNSGPSRVSQPSINASRAGQIAMDQYDTNHDGVVSKEELEKAPGLKASLANLDTNSDGAVSADEIAAEIQRWQALRLGLMTMGFKITLNGAPLEGATVTFEPEEFLGGNIKPAVTTTDLLGTGGPTIPKDQRPDPSAPPGIQLGIYRVKVSKIVNGKETIPAKYNENTVLGQLVAPDVSEIVNRRVTYALTTK